jgi:transcriptional regulator with XRE-family HTH domain
MVLRKITRTEQWKIAGKILKGVRKSRNITQLELAEIIEVPQSSISFIESGKRGIPDEMLGKLSKVLNVPESMLIAPNVLEEKEYKDFIFKRLKELLTIN